MNEHVSTITTLEQASHEAIRIPLSPGDFSINPDADDILFLEINKDKYTGDKTAKFNPDLCLSGISNLGKLDDYSNWTGCGYQVERIITNSIAKKELDEDGILRILEWNKDENNLRGSSTDYEGNIIAPLLKAGMVSEKILDWLLEKRRNEYTMLRLIENEMIPPEQIKETVLNSEDSYLKWKLIDDGIVNCKDYSYNDIAQLYLGADKKYLGASVLYGRIAEKILPYFEKELQEKFVQVAIEEIIELFKQEEIKNEEKESNSYYSEFGDIVRNITYHSRYLSDELLIHLIKELPEKMILDYSSNLPGWAFKGLLLKHKISHSTWEHNNIRDFNKEEYKNKYELMDKIFLEEPPADTILTEKEQAEILDEVKLCGLKLFEPIYIDEGDESVSFVHISGKPSLKCLTPRRARGTDRYLSDHGVFLQRGKFQPWQLDHLKSVNEGKTYSYGIKLPIELLAKKIVYRDDRWEGGYRTKRPIILDKETELTWEMFNPIMKMEAVRYYEKIYGNLPSELKNRLFSGDEDPDYQA